MTIVATESNKAPYYTMSTLSRLTLLENFLKSVEQDSHLTQRYILWVESLLSSSEFNQEKENIYKAKKLEGKDTQEFTIDKQEQYFIYFLLEMSPFVNEYGFHDIVELLCKCRFHDQDLSSLIAHMTLLVGRLDLPTTPTDDDDDDRKSVRYRIDEWVGPIVRFGNYEERNIHIEGNIFQSIMNDCTSINDLNIVGRAIKRYFQRLLHFGRVSYAHDKYILDDIEDELVWFAIDNVENLQELSDLVNTSLIPLYLPFVEAIHECYMTNKSVYDSNDFICHSSNVIKSYCILRIQVQRKLLQKFESVKRFPFSLEYELEMIKQHPNIIAYQPWIDYYQYCNTLFYELNEKFNVELNHFFNEQIVIDISDEIDDIDSNDSVIYDFHNCFNKLNEIVDLEKYLNLLISIEPLSSAKLQFHEEDKSQSSYLRVTDRGVLIRYEPATGIHGDSSVVHMMVANELLLHFPNRGRSIETIIHELEAYLINSSIHFHLLRIINGNENLYKLLFDKLPNITLLQTMDILIERLTNDLGIECAKNVLIKPTKSTLDCDEETTTRSTKRRRVNTRKSNDLTVKPSIKIGILDSGLDPDHHEIGYDVAMTTKGKLTFNAFTNRKYEYIISNDENNRLLIAMYRQMLIHDNYKIIDNHGHGCRVTAAIAADHSNQIINTNDGFDLIICKVATWVDSMNTVCTSIEAFRTCIEFCIEHHVDIINLSYDISYFSDDHNVRFAFDKMKNIFAFTCAAGNSGVDISGCPLASLIINQENIITVAATTFGNDIADKESLRHDSNFSRTVVKCAAPGSNIETYDLKRPNVARHCLDCGTSLASPIVAAHLARVKAKHPDESLKNLLDMLMIGRVKHDEDGVDKVVGNRHLIPITL